MTRLQKALWAGMVLLVASGMVQGQVTGHYPLGSEGIKAATLPPPGLYLKTYQSFYTADELKDRNGDELDVGFDVFGYALVPRLIWITEWDFLGADYGMDVLLPFVYSDVEVDALGYADDEFGMGDLCFEPIDLAWHGPQYDLAWAFAVWFPTGEYDRQQTLSSPGKDFWSYMFTFGGTYYLDEEKSWSASALGRYEIHDEGDDLDVTPGNNILFEWGVAKTFEKVLDVGVIGYCQWQLTDDRGSDVTWDPTVHDRVAGIGPEIAWMIPEHKLLLSVRSAWEFSAVDRAEGNTTTLTITTWF